MLCPPGWKVPHAHNLIEALAMGCIPIINYADLMTPPLRDHVNCLAFTTLEQLVIILETLPKFSLERIEAMRQEALDYYLLYLDPASVGRSLMASLPTITRVSFNDETSIVISRSKCSPAIYSFARIAGDWLESAYLKQGDCSTTCCRSPESSSDIEKSLSKCSLLQWFSPVTL